MAEESYRDRSVLITKEGKRIWMYPKSVKGFYHTNRVLFGIILLAIFLFLPLIKVCNEPFFLFNVIDRKFILFSVIFWPQDSYLFFLTMITLILFIILFTVTYGRLWCGWACPQTIFMEIVFRKIEYLIEGNPAKQRKLNNEPLSVRKMFIKSIKHIVFWVVSYIISFTIISYILSHDRMMEMLKSPFAEQNYTVFITSVILATVIYFIYSQVRELVCTIICPYGRLQGVLVDQHTMVVAYDYMRGEPRDARSKENTGDCIDCKQCVTVCPTGMDIRNGTQLECISCTACIDACNSVMKKVNKPKGLIRYASLDQIRQGQKFKLTTRGYAYSAVLVLLISFLVYMLASRSPIDATILRTPGLIYQEQANNEISNLYNIKALNKSRRDYNLTIKLISNEGRVEFAGSEFVVKARESSEGVFFVYINKNKLTSEKLKLKFGIFDGDRLLEIKSATFIGPSVNVAK
jgi:cytochrome c oxidase accessory protein FixG